MEEVLGEGLMENREEVETIMEEILMEEEGKIQDTEDILE